MEGMTMKMNLLELYELVGDDKGVSFYYDELPGIIVSIGFTTEETYEREVGSTPPEGDDDDEPQFH